jgi:hypothetical protein
MGKNSPLVLDVEALTYTWQEGEGKYYNNEGNKSNNNARRVIVT